MKKILIISISSIIILGLLGTFYIFFGSSAVIPKNHVKVIIKNESGMSIESLTLTHEKGVSKLNDIEMGTEREILFYSAGENSYIIELKLENDSILISTGTYVESGYTMKEIVTSNEIKTDFNTY